MHHGDPIETGSTARPKTLFWVGELFRIWGWIGPAYQDDLDSSMQCCLSQLWGPSMRHIGEMGLEWLTVAIVKLSRRASSAFLNLSWLMMNSIISSDRRFFSRIGLFKVVTWYDSIFCGSICHHVASYDVSWHILMKPWTWVRFESVLAFLRWFLQVHYH